jgi:hypothetical protein
MSMSNAAEAALLDLLFGNTAWANVGDASGLQPSAADGNFYISLHTADPGEAGNQQTSEATYTGYAREAVSRDAAGFTRSVSTVSNTATVQFDECTSGSNTITHFAVGTASSGAGQIIVSGALNTPRTISAGITPLFNAGTLSATVD